MCIHVNEDGKNIDFREKEEKNLREIFSYVPEK